MEPLSDSIFEQIQRRFTDSRYSDLREEVQQLADTTKRGKVPMSSDMSPEEHTKYLETHIHLLQKQVLNLNYELHWADEQRQLAEDQSEEWRKKCAELSTQLVKSSEESTKNLLILALHWAERAAIASLLAQHVTGLITHLEALLSDTPEPATFVMLDNIKKHVEAIHSPPSERVQSLLAQVVPSSGKSSES